MQFVTFMCEVAFPGPHSADRIQTHAHELTLINDKASNEGTPWGGCRKKGSEPMVKDVL